jgi:hypothetical protein
VTPRWASNREELPTPPQQFEAAFFHLLKVFVVTLITSTLSFVEPQPTVAFYGNTRHTAATAETTGCVPATHRAFDLQQRCRLR